MKQERERVHTSISMRKDAISVVNIFANTKVMKMKEQEESIILKAPLAEVVCRIDNLSNCIQKISKSGFTKFAQIKFIAGHY